MKFITKSQFDFFWENGYLIVKDLVPREEWQDLLEDLRNFHDKNWASIMNPDRPEFLISQAINHFPKEGKIKEQTEWILYAHDVAKRVRKLMKNKSIVLVLEDLYGEEVSALMSHILWKEPGTPYADQWWHPHQDNSYAKNPEGKYFTTNLFFHDADPSNGMLNIYPGTHKYGMLPYDPNISYHEDPGATPGNNTVFPDDYDHASKKTDLYVESGDFLIMHGDCVHGSYPNTSDRSRNLLSASYVTKGAFFEPGISAQRKEISLRGNE
mgnify:CR=1 FL=1